MRSESAQELQQFAETLQAALVAHGFVIHRYDAASTNSIYLKVDYGVGNSIRISDHNGKQHLQYKYNINTQTKKYRADRSKQYPRFYYSLNEMDLLIHHILDARAQRVRRSGQASYNWSCLQHKQQATTVGFWQFAHKVGGPL